MPLIRTYRLRRKKPDRRQQLTLLSAVLLTAALLAGTWYVANERAPTPHDPAEATWTTLKPGSTSSQTTPTTNPSSQAPPTTNPSSQAPPTTNPSFRTPQSGDPESTSPSPRTTPNPETILRCHDPEIGDFYTNAPTCAAADPHNRITIAEPLVTHSAENTYSGQNYTTPEQDAGNSRSD
ncbi:hypothetical protein [Elongatibacter sediminis]|uniref:Uncharacterized protein n=1 Tax=Elongatibacter sediminis TaxID=3119006 RepID=A0AAW9RM94_9GAMM